MSDDIARRLDYELDETVDGTSLRQMRALGDPLRSLLLDLVLERAMSVTELAERVGRPRGSVAHHVKVLQGAGLLNVVRTRRVRAVDERFYGRTARTIKMGDVGDGLPFVAEATAQADYARMRRDEPGSGFTMRHARIPPERAVEYLEQLTQLAIEFSSEPRDGDTEFALLCGIFPTIRPVTPRKSTPEQAPTRTAPE